MNTRNTRGFLSLPLLILIGVILAGSAGVGTFAYFRHVPASEPKEAVLPEFEARVASSSTADIPVKIDKKAPATASATQDPIPESQQDTAEAIRAAEKAQLKKQTQLHKSEDIDRVWSNQPDDRSQNETRQTDAYNQKNCLAQKKELLPTVEAQYEVWFKKWQNARAELNSCYDTNSIPYCDARMGEVNVHWESKWSTEVKSYYPKLDQCAPEDRRFGDVSSMLSSY